MRHPESIYNCHLNSKTILYAKPVPDPISSMSESETEEVEADSVIQNMKDRRKASGQEIADIKLRTKLYGSGAIKDATSKKPFMDQFPYKSCQRGYQPTRKKHMSLPDRRSKDDDPGAMLKS